MTVGIYKQKLLTRSQLTTTKTTTTTVLVIIIQNYRSNSVVLFTNHNGRLSIIVILWGPLDFPLNISCC